MSLPTAAAEAPAREDASEALREARERTFELVEGISEQGLEQVHSKLMSPLAWDLGHIAAFEDLWLAHRFGGRPLLREDLIHVYDASETPRADRGSLPFLAAPQVREYMEEVRERSLQVISEQGTSDRFHLELVIRHEHQHNETMVQTLELAHIEGSALSARLDDQDLVVSASPGNAIPTGLELIEIPGGECTIGASAGRFSYDNERPAHLTQVERFALGATPVTNGAYLRFIREGGYRRREWWSAEGWAWKEQNGVARPQGWREDGEAQWRLGRLGPLAPSEPVVHVSWFEAEAFCRAHHARLPTEAEWEKAASWGLQRDEAGPDWWEDPVAGIHANIDLVHRGPAPVGSFPAGTSPSGCLGMIGDVWEWTSSDFTGYPGFLAHPYREYSEVFFGQGYKVLRGGSWATRARVITPTFRNWDYPQRRQIFSGFRIARDG